MLRPVFPSTESLSRQDLVRSPVIWRTVGFTFALFAIATGLLSFLMPGIDPWRLRLLSATLFAVTAVLLSRSAPRPDTPWAHVLLSLTYAGPAFAIWAFAPAGSAAVSTAMFAGPLAAMWTTRRSHQIAHLLLASVVIFIPTAIDEANAATTAACIALVPAIWILSYCVSVVLEAGEEQGKELAILIRRDPLTGVGNRRMLDERLGAAVVAGMPFSLLTFDLNGFKALNDEHGHAAGDAVLVTVARALQHATARIDGATVIRQGGDEFAALLPDAGVGDAANVGDAIRDAIDTATAATAEGAVTTGLGVATFPVDGTTAATLVEHADAALRADKPASRTRPPAASRASAPARPTECRSALDAAATPCGAAPVTASTSLTSGLIGRREMQFSPGVWGAHAAMYLLYAVMGVLVDHYAPELTGDGFLWIVGFGGLVGIVFLVDGPPPLESRANHAAISFSYLVPTVILVLCQPGGSIAVGCLIFVGPLIATRLTSRWQIVGHWAFASALLLVLIPTGLVDAATHVSILLAVLATWILGGCCVYVLEAAEAQTIALRSLVGRDALTGVANRRALDELLAQQLPGRSNRHPLTLLTFDFNGFKVLNDTVGHAAGDTLLQEAAVAMQDCATSSEHVFRQGGDEFCIVSLETIDPQRRIAEYRDALASVDCNGAPLTTGAGWAVAPTDADTAEPLLAAADARLLADKRHGPAGATRGATGTGSGGGRDATPDRSVPNVA